MRVSQRMRSAGVTPRLTLGLAIAAVGTAATLAGQTDVPRVEADPMTAPVGPPQAIVDPLGDDQFAKQFAAALKEAGPTPAVEKAPERGVRITRVDPESPAEAASLRVGDVIVAIDDKPTPTAEVFRKLREAATEDQTLEIIPSGSTPARSKKVPPGHLGFDIADAWILQGQYLHALPAGVTAVDEIRVAAIVAATNPTLAESALARARKAGGPGTTGPVVDAIAAVALYDDCWFESALAYATAAAKGLPVESRGQLNRVIFDSAVATFRYPIAQAIAKKDDTFAAAAAVIAKQAGLARDQKTDTAEPDPAETQIVFTDQTKKAVNLSKKENGMFAATQWALDNLKRNNGYPFKAPDGRFNLAQFGPGGLNVEFYTDCHFAATDDGRAGYPKVVRLELDSKGGGRKMVELFADGAADVTEDFGGPVASLNLKRLIGDNRKFHLRMIAVGGRYEVVIDGRRVFYGPLPVDDERELSLSIQTVGVTGDFSHAHWRTAGAK